MRNKRQRAVCVCVCRHHHQHNAPYNAACVTLLLAKVIALLPRLLNGQVRQLQTNSPGSTPATPDWHTLSTHNQSQSEGGIVGGKRNQTVATL